MDITSQNSWWKSGGLWQDPDLKRIQNSPLKYHPRPFQAELCQSPVVMTLRGPRRVGKTVTLKLLVAELIEEHRWLPRNILWLNFDTLRTLAQAENFLTEVVGLHKPKLLVIDEVTSVLGWQRVIKKLRDTGLLSGICIILTGSSAHDLKAGAERMAGRRGDIQNPDRVLLPLSFHTFQEQLRQNSLILSLINQRN